MIRAIAALDENRGIGLRGKTPWHIPDELRYFKARTEYGVVVMGRLTYELFTEPLVNRRNIVISRSLQIPRPGFELLHDLAILLNNPDTDIWVIGGAELFKMALAYCDELYLTHVTGDFGCDRFFPPYEADFVLQGRLPEQSQNGYSYYHAIYQHKDRQA